MASAPALAVTKAEVLDNDANIARSDYGDALTLARALDGAVKALIAPPSDATLQSAKTAWLAVRVPCQQN